MFWLKLLSIHLEVKLKKRLDLQRIEKLQKRLNPCMKRPMYAKQMTDNEIREKFVEAKEWKKGFAQMIV